LAGIPLMSGFWSKDEILAGASQNGYWVVFGMGVITALMTAAYTTRAVWLTFYGEYRGHAHPHESPKVITVPLVILAALAFVVMFANIPKGLGVPEAYTLRFEHFVQPTFVFPALGEAAGQLPEVHFNGLLAIASFIIAGLSEKVAPFRAIHTLLVNKYYLDALYTDIIVGSIKRPIANAMYWINMNIIDKVVVGAGVVARLIGGFVYKFIDQGVVDTIVNGSGMGAEGGGQFLRRSQTGKVQQYGSLLFGGAVAFALVLIVAIQLSSNV
jgi:NADH-quinone oxidoreductase subunit L